MCLVCAFSAADIVRGGELPRGSQTRKHWSEWSTVKVAACQVDIHTGREIDRIVEYVDHAGADGADLVVFGEYLLGAFHGSSPGVERVAEAARKNGIYVIVGGWEEFEPGAYAAKKPRAFANTALIFGRDGQIIGKYRKAHQAVGDSSHCWPPKGDEHEWLMKPGDGFPTFQLDFARIGIMTCYDGFFPECASSLSLGGAEIIIWINGRAGPTETFIVQADMFRNYCAMVTTNLGPGSGTMIGTWPNVILAQVTETGNHYISAQINLKELRWRRANSRTFHQRRPDIYGAVVQKHAPWKVYNLAGDYAVLRPPAGDGGGTQVDDVPFRRAALWTPTVEGETFRVPAGGIEARSLYVLGCLNDPDVCHPAWGGGDDVRNFFIGDNAGTLAIRYASGARDRIPLVFGYTVGWSQNYRMSPEPFRSDESARAELDAALCVANGLDGFASDGQSYYLKIALRDEPVEAIELEDNPKKVGHFKLDGLTFGEVSQPDRIDTERYLRMAGGDPPAERAKWLTTHTISGADSFPAARREALEHLRRRYHMRAEDVTEETVAATPTQTTAENFPGPKVRFSGPPTATLMTNIYYENANGLLSRVDDDTGMVHESAAKSDRYDGFGGWTPDWGGYYDTAYTRLRGLTLLSNMGFNEKVNKAIGFFDRWLMYFPRSYPDLQLGGKPVPGHATVIANKPHIYFDELRHVGWPTKYTTRDFGNPENDGHGLLMVSRWRAWVKQGRSREWVEQRWEAINEAAEYIPWCLDNPKLSFSQHGLLHNESEGGMMKQSMYCDFCCYLGLSAYADMADAAGKKEKAERWRAQAKRLFGAMEPYYHAKVEPWGDVWDPKKSAMFNHGHATLAPAVIGMDFWGYDVMRRLPPGWAETTRRTYKMQLTHNRPRGAAPAGIGYGQGYITEAALLLDEMRDASEMVDWMAKMCFAPRLPHPYRVPEGSIIGDGGSIWRRWGDLGNLYQLGEVIYTIHLILGVDDVETEQLLVMPRLPLSWTGMSVREWPVRTMSGGKSAFLKLSYDLRCDGDGRSFDLDIRTDQPLDAVRVRAGPFPADCDSVLITCNGQRIKASLESSGDSQWAWIELGDGATTVFKLSAEAER